MVDEQLPQEYYRITVKGHIGNDWSDWFDDLTLTPTDDGNTLLAGPLVDQVALHGVLNRIRDLGLHLLSLRRVEAGDHNTSSTP